jgi:hypothetical protein
LQDREDEGSVKDILVESFRVLFQIDESEIGRLFKKAKENQLLRRSLHASVSRREGRKSGTDLDLDELTHKVLLDVLVFGRERFFELQCLRSKRRHLSDERRMLSRRNAIANCQYTFVWLNLIIS